MKISQGDGQSYTFVDQWDRDEGATSCFADTIAETHTNAVQHGFWEISTQ